MLYIIFCFSEKSSKHYKQRTMRNNINRYVYKESHVKNNIIFLYCSLFPHLTTPAIPVSKTSATFQHSLSVIEVSWGTTHVVQVLIFITIVKNIHMQKIILKLVLVIFLGVKWHLTVNMIKFCLSLSLHSKIHSMEK